MPYNPIAKISDLITASIVIRLMGLTKSIYEKATERRLVGTAPGLGALVAIRDMPDADTRNRDCA